MRLHLVPILLWSAIATGCAINDTGFVKVDRFENEYGYFIRTRVWGVHLVTVASDEGLTVGYSDRGYFIPKAKGGDASELAHGQSAQLGCPMSPMQDQAIGLTSLGAPVSIRTMDAGLGIRAGETRAGVMLGMNSNTRLRLQQGRTTVVTVRFDSEDIDALGFYYNGGAKN